MEKLIDEDWDYWDDSGLENIGLRDYLRLLELEDNVDGYNYCSES